jgi:small-conductance mechanosensitive channel
MAAMTDVTQDLHEIALKTWATLDTSTDTVFDVVKTIAVYLVVRFAVKRIVNRVLIPALVHGTESGDAAHVARLRTLASLVNSLVSYVLAFVFGVMLLRAVHLDPIPLLTTASVAGLAVGFGAQKLVKDVISGFFILLENQYAIGDYVTIGTATGTVVEVGMRTTRIRDDSGRLYLISNGDISQVINSSRGSILTTIDIGIPIDADVGVASKAIDAAGEELFETRKDLGLDRAPKTIGLSASEAAKLTLRVSCNVDDPAKLSQAQVAMRSLAYDKLAAAGIKPA